MIGRYIVPLKAALILTDGASALAVFLLLFNVRFEMLGGEWSLGSIAPIQVAMVYAGLWVGALWLLGLYRLRTHWAVRGEIRDVLRATVIVLVVSLSILYILNLTDVSRIFVGMLLLTQPLVTITFRLVLRRVLERLRSRGQLQRRMLIVGAGPEAQQFADIVEGHRELGLTVIGHLYGTHRAEELVTRPVIGSIEQIETFLHDRVVDEVAICLAPEEWSYVEPVTRICEEEGKIVRVSVQALGGVLTGGQFEEVGGLPIVTFLYGPDRAVGMLAKRTFDIVVSALLLVVLIPLFLIVALYIRLGDGPPVLFRQGRIGLHGRAFVCLKFRTMIPDAEEQLDDLIPMSDVSGPAFKMLDDPRITPAGRFLRRSSLDELPQLWNVLSGEMSIVGPRPATPREVAQYSIWHRRRLSMRPGLTGLWQVSARSEVDFDRRVELDLDYIDRWSLWMDLKILIRTIPVIVAQEGR